MNHESTNYDFYRLNVKMIGLVKGKLYCQLYDDLKLNDNYDIDIEELGENEVQFSSSNIKIFDNLENALCKFSKEYPNQIIIYEKDWWKDYLNRLEDREYKIYYEYLNHLYCCVKNGIKTAMYLQYYKLVSDDGVISFDKDAFYKYLKIKSDECILLDKEYICFGGGGAHHIVFKKPLQIYYKILNDDIDKKEEIGYYDFVKFFSDEELDIFKCNFETKNIKEDTVTTSLFIDSNENEKIGNETVADLEKGLAKALREGGYKKLEQVVSKWW